ncbi:hypothetical protein D3C80_956650 [compost metagenome]
MLARLAVQRGYHLDLFDDIRVGLSHLHTRLGRHVLNRCVHDSAGIAIGGGENAVLVAGRFCATNVADDLEVCLPLEEALPNRAGNSLSLGAGPTLDERRQQLATAGTAHTKWVGQHSGADSRCRRRDNIQRHTDRCQPDQARCLKLSFVVGDVDQVEVQLGAVTVEDAQQEAVDLLQ